MLLHRDGKILLLFISFLIIYLLPGIYGHTPWKQDENYTFGVIQTMYETGNWLVPVNAGEPFMEKPPLYYWTATLMAHLFSGMMPLHDAARSATLLFSIINFSFFILLARRVFRSESLVDYRIWLAFAVYISAPGILRHSHDMFSDTALTAGATVALYGIVGLIRQEKVAASAVWLGLGTIATMLSKGVFIPGVLWITLFLSAFFFTQCRTKAFWYPVILSGLLALIFILPWPVLLYSKHPDLFMAWFWENNIGRFLGFSVAKLGAKANLMRVPEAVALFALPAGMLATVYFLRHPLQRLRNPDEFVITLFPLLGIIILQMSATSRALYLMPFVAPMAILGSQLLPAIKEKALRYFSCFAVALWSASLAGVWGIYLLKVGGDQKGWLAPLERWLPASYELHLSWPPFVFALVVTALWICRGRLSAALNPVLRAAFSWGLGVTVVWSVAFTLMVGWFDYSKGYAGVFKDLKSHLAGQYLADDCMASYRLGESEAPMLYYFAGILHQPQTTFRQPERCRWLIVLGDKLQPAPKGMVFFWEDNRPGEKRNNLMVYRDVSKNND
ncbi:MULTISPECIES: ArnT family glycosyltransferase [unclassified Cedecea]|uniref:ArnT family glycosyltransferase n=1 Tax=unclassified Cedecea TaxID=2649846 RepID=UPI00301ACC13